MAYLNRLHCWEVVQGWYQKEELSHPAFLKNNFMVFQKRFFHRGQLSKALENEGRLRRETIPKKEFKLI